MNDRKNRRKGLRFFRFIYSLLILCVLFVSERAVYMRAYMALAVAFRPPIFCELTHAAGPDHATVFEG